MREYLEFTYKDEIAFRGFYLHERNHPWLFVVMEDPYYKILLEKELFVNRTLISKQSIAQQYDMTEWAGHKRGFYPERLAKQMMVLDYLNDTARQYVYFPRTRSSRESKYPFLDFLNTDIKDGVEGVAQGDSLHTDNTNKQEG
jgi:hypothetical protein